MRKHLAIIIAVGVVALLGAVILVWAHACDHERGDHRQGAYQRTNLRSDIKGLAA